MPGRLKRKRSTEKKDSPCERDDVVMSDELVESASEEEWNGVRSEQRDSMLRKASESLTGNPKKPPTGEELRRITDASDLYRSSSFKFQIDALLPNVRPKSSRIAPLERTLFALHAVLQSVPSIEPQHPLEAACALRPQISVPYSLPLPRQETKWKLAFAPPSDVTLVGSWPLERTVKKVDGLPYGVDLAVEMPDSLFQEKDYLDGRYFHKRAFYLACLAAAIQNTQSNLKLEVRYESLRYDPRLTVLALFPLQDDNPNDFTSLNAYIRIIPTLSQSSPIPIQRLSASHSNIRLPTPSSTGSSTSFSSTPLYNSALLLAFAPKSNLLSSHALSESAPSIRDALALLRIWAAQRGYIPGKTCVHGFEGTGPFWEGMMALVVLGEEPHAGGKGGRKALGRGLSSYQLFRGALDFLARHDFGTTPVFVRSKEGQKFSRGDYPTGSAVFVGTSSGVNVLAGVPLSSLEMLRHDARMTLQVLDTPTLSQNAFTDTFLKDHREMASRFDVVIQVDLSQASPKLEALAIAESGSLFNALLESLTSILRRGLSDRAHAIAVIQATATSTPRPLTQTDPVHPCLVHIGLVYDPENAFSLVDLGPPAVEDGQENEESERFRTFWGDKAELRRFKDGRIVESVVWDVSTSDERAYIPLMIVRHLLKTHLAIEGGGIKGWGAAFDRMVRLPESVSAAFKARKNPEVGVGFRGAMDAFDRLSKGVKALGDELPLTVASLSPSSEYLRRTSIFAPVPISGAGAGTLRYLPAIEIILQFERSSRWPDDLRAIQKIKLAFFEQLANALMNTIPNLKAVVVVGDRRGQSEVMDVARLEIVTSEGWAFWVRIWHDREETLLRRILESNGKVNPAQPHVRISTRDNGGSAPDARARDEARDALEVYYRRFTHGPLHHRSVAALCHAYGAFAGTVRLVKRWLAAHWLSGHITPEAIELICAAHFLPRDNSKERVGVPSSRERGFAVVVGFLDEWRWEEGLDVALYAGADASVGEMASKGKGVGGVSSAAWKIRTEVDKEGTMWTSQGPDVIVANRVKALARATKMQLAKMADGSLEVKTLFTHPTDDYDFIINLDPVVLPRYAQNVAFRPDVLSKKSGKKYANLDAVENATSTIRPAFDPAQMFYEDLNRIYANTLKLFFDSCGGDKIGAVWDPTLKDARPFRVFGGFSSIPTNSIAEKDKSRPLVNVNQVAVLAEIERMGRGIVKDISINAK